MLRTTVILLPALALAACNTGPKAEVTNTTTTNTMTSATSPAPAPAGGTMGTAGAPVSFISPGHWDGTMTLDDFSMPGMPPEALAQVKAKIAENTNLSSCVTPEEAADPTKAMMGKDDNSCKVDRNTIANGTIDTQMTCTSEGNSQTIAVSGNYTPDSYHVVTKVSGSGAQTMAMTMTLDAKRNGECTGKETANGLSAKAE